MLRNKRPTCSGYIVPADNWLAYAYEPVSIISHDIILYHIISYRIASIPGVEYFSVFNMIVVYTGSSASCVWSLCNDQ